MGQEHQKRRPRLRRVIEEIGLALLLLLVVGFLDYSTGLQLRLFPLYFVPVGLIAWRSGQAAGLFVSVFSISTWEVANLYAGMLYDTLFVSVWNIVIQLASLVAFSTLLSRLRALIEKERTTSRLDALTEIANSRSFFESLAYETERARRYQRTLTLAYLDLDNFKTVNDKQGHKAGDQVLRQIARILKDNCRSTDHVARLGGDEFAILMPETPLDSASVVLERLQKNIRAQMQQANYPVTVSIGATVFQTIPKDPDDMIKRADALMYQVKSSGKNAFRVEPC